MSAAAEGANDENGIKTGSLAIKIVSKNGRAPRWDRRSRYPW